MPLDADAIRAYPFAPREQCVTDNDAMLYALSIGVGRDPLDRDELCYVFEQDLKVFPTMPIVLGHPGPWMDDPALGIDRRMLVHGTQRIELHGELRADAPFVASNRVVEVVDKGAEVGGLIVLERTLHDKASGALIARMESGIFCRADGGFGGAREASHAFRPVPESVPEASADMPTDINQALWYRLNGDRNPLHASPEYASKAGFPRPILHGLCTFSVAGYCLMRLRPGQALTMLEGRFSKPVFPGDTIRIEAWTQADGIAFRAIVAERQAVVLDRGLARFSSPD